jgi:RNA polymerase sigma factor (sigma-70 family)
MAGGALQRVVQRVRLLTGPRGGPQSDGELLRRFAAHRDEAAFTALVWRHAPMVLGLGRRLLGDHHDAEDVCQAAFLLLARKAGSIRNRQSVASWLHGVAYRIAANVRRKAARRRTCPLGDDVCRPDPTADVSWREVCAAVDTELTRLPEKYRAPLVLCYLEGMTRDEAARHLGCPAATLRGRLARGRRLLRGQLTRRGLALSVALLAAGLARGATEKPAALVLATASAVLRGTVSSHVVALSEGVLRAMLLTQVKSLVLALLTAGILLGAVGGGFAYLRGNGIGALAAPQAPAAPAPRDEDKAEKGPAIKGELKKLEGAWKVVAVESDGRKADDGEIEDFHYIFGADGTWKLRQDGRVIARGTFAIDPTKKPKTIDFKIEETVSQRDKGKTSRGVYELDGDGLKVCRDWPGEEARPTDFAAGAGSKRILGEYRRAKDADTADPPEDVADVASRRLLAGGDENKRYYLIGIDPDRKGPEGGHGLVVVLPGGAGGADFNPFVRRIWKNGLPDGYLVAQPVAVKWTPQQEVVWPTKKLPAEKMKFGTEEFVAAVVKDVAKRQPIDRGRVFTLAWSSSGPAAYAVSLEKASPVTGSFIAMSVFKPNLLPELTNARGRAYFLHHAKEDRVCPYRFAEQARDALTGAGARVELQTYEGGHGWRGDVYGDIRTGIEWLFSLAHRSDSSHTERRLSASSPKRASKRKQRVPRRGPRRLRGRDMVTTPASLLDQMRQPDARAAWELFARLYTPLLFCWARRLGLQDQDAADLVQDVFAVLVRKLPTFRYEPGKSFRAWLRTVTLNKWRDARRHSAREREYREALLARQSAEEGDVFAENEYRQRVVARALQLMQTDFQPLTWRAFWEHGACGRPAVEVAAELGLTAGAVYSAKFRVMDRLRKELRGLLD